MLTPPPSLMRVTTSQLRHRRQTGDTVADMIYDHVYEGGLIRAKPIRVEVPAAMIQRLMEELSDYSRSVDLQMFAGAPVESVTGIDEVTSVWSLEHGETIIWPRDTPVVPSVYRIQ